MTSAEPTGMENGGPARTAGSRRGAARVAVVQALYQIDIAGAPVATVLREFSDHRLEGRAGDTVDHALFADVVRGTIDAGADLDAMIAPILVEGWTMARLDRVLRAILRAGAYEISARRDVPPRVAINEYVNVAHAFFDGHESRIVNGVLDRLAHTLRAEEMAERGDSGGGTAGPEVNG